MAQLHAGGVHEQSGRNVERAVESRRAEDDLVGTLLGVFDEFLQRLVRLLIVADEDAGIGDVARERNEIRIGELRLPAEQPVNLGKAGDRGQMGQQRVAVRLGVGGDLSAHLPGRARLGVDHDRLLHHRLEDCRQRAHDDVDRAAGRKRVDHGDGACGIGVLREGGPEGGRRSGRADDEAASIHAFLLLEKPDFGAGMFGADRSEGPCPRQPRPVCAFVSAGYRGEFLSMMATARVQPAEAPRILTGKQLTVNPLAGSASRLCSFSMWQ